MQKRNRRTVDRAQRLLRILGWSYGDMSHFDGIATIWQVYAHRDEQRIVARAFGQAQAWDEALRLAGVVQRADT